VASARSTVGGSLHWCYANLAMAHAALDSGATAYGRPHFMVRARLLKGLTEGTMAVGSLVEDERLKFVLPRACCYCGTDGRLSVDHLIPTSRGGLDSGDNIVWSCGPCNSSKGATDLLRWYAGRGEFPPLPCSADTSSWQSGTARFGIYLGCRLPSIRTFRSIWRPYRKHSRPPGELVLWRVPLGSVEGQQRHAAPGTSSSGVEPLN